MREEWSNRLKLMPRLFKGFIALISAIFMLFGILISWNLASLYFTYREISKLSLKTTEVARIERDLGRHVENLYKYISLPPFKQIISLRSSRIFDSQDDFIFLAKNSLTLSGYGQSRKYILVFQNSAEARGTGGIIGAYAIINLKNGKLTVIEAASNLKLKSVEYLPILHSADYFKLYGNNPGIWQNANLSPHFPYGAKNYLELWRLQTGEELDGVIATDPVALSYLLRSTGDIKMSNSAKLSAKNLVEETLKTAYKRFENDNYARKNYLVEIINATFERLLSGNFKKLTLIEAVAQSIRERRIQIYLTEPSIQSKIEKYPIGGALNLSPDNTYRVVIQNTDASKLDYYLEREIDLQSVICRPQMRSQITVYLRNQVSNPKDLPPYVLTRADKNKPIDLVTGQHRFKVYIYGPYESKLIGGSLGSGKNGNARTAFERGRPIFIEDLDLAPGGGEIIVVQFSHGTGRLSYLDQPLVKPSLVQIKDNC